MSQASSASTRLLPAMWGGRPVTLPSWDLNRQSTTFRLDDDDDDDSNSSSEDEEYVQRVRMRFESDFLPHYGPLWRKLIAINHQSIPSQQQHYTIQHDEGTPDDKNLVDTSADPHTFPDNDDSGVTFALHQRGFLYAIENKLPVVMSFRDHDGDCNCGCVPPVDELTDTIDEGTDGQLSLAQSTKSVTYDRALCDTDDEDDADKEEMKYVYESMNYYQDYSSSQQFEAGGDGNGDDENDEGDKNSTRSRESANKFEVDSSDSVPSSPESHPSAVDGGHCIGSTLPVEQRHCKSPLSCDDSSDVGVYPPPRSFSQVRDKFDSTEHVYELQDTESDVASVENDTDESENEAEWMSDQDDDNYDSKSSRPTGQDAGNIEDLVRRTETIDLVDSSEDDSSIEVIKRITNPIPNKRVEAVTGGKRSTTSKPKFSSSRDRFTTEAFKEFNIKVFGGKLGAVQVVWSKKLYTTAGLTRLRKTSNNTTPEMPPQRHAMIELSIKVLDDEEKLRTTLLHEMIHAAVWLLEGVSKPPHGDEFKRWARKAMKAIPGVTVTTTHSYDIQFKYAWSCTSPGCSFLVKRHSKSVDPNRHVCGRCKGRLIQVVSGQGDVGSSKAPKKPPQPTAYNIFIKEQSKTVRKNLLEAERVKGNPSPSVSQADVMKECGRLWSERKNESV